MKKVICGIFVSLALVACSQGESVATGKNSVVIDKVDGGMNITYNENTGESTTIITTGKNSLAIGSEENVNITYNDSSISSEKNKDFETETNNSMRQIAIATGKNGVAINSSGDISVNDGNENVSATGNDSVSVVNGKAFMNGKELDMDLSHGVSISYNGNEMTVNGQKPKFKDKNN